jgi:hypothetical protein
MNLVQKKIIQGSDEMEKNLTTDSVTGYAHVRQNPRRFKRLDFQARMTPSHHDEKTGTASQNSTNLLLSNGGILGLLAQMDYVKKTYQRCCRLVPPNLRASSVFSL